MALLHGNQIVAQKYPVQRFTHVNGIAHDNVYRIFQDSRGFLWFGTEYGLSRFDGRKFKNYASGASSFKTVMCINETPDKNIWVCTYSGQINVIADGQVIRKHFKGDTIINSVKQAYRYKDVLWIIDKSGSLYYFKNGTTVKPFIRILKDKEIQFRRICQSKNGSLIFTSDNGLYADSGNNVVVPYLMGMVHETVYTAYYDTDNSLWLGLAGRIIQIVNEKIVKSYPTGTSNEISDFIIDHEKNMWAAIPSTGVLFWRHGQIRNISKELNLENVLVNCFFEDLNKNIWIATHGSGLYCVKTINILNYPVSDGKVNNYVTAITNFEGKVYIGSIGTVCRYDGNKVMRLHSKFLHASDYIYYIKCIGNELYIGTPKGVLIKNIQDEDKEVFITTQGSTALYSASDGNLWCSRFSDIGVFHNQSFQVNKLLSNQLHCRINDIATDSSNNMLLASNNGLFIVGKSKITHILDKDSNAIRINSIFIDHIKRIWLATDHGAYMIQGSQIHHYTVKTGLSHDEVNGFAEDAGGNIWIASLAGIDKFNGSVLGHLGLQSGLISEEALSICIDNESNIWVGTVNGLSCITSSEMQAVKPELKAYIVAAHIKNSTLEFPEGAITLSYDDRNLDLDFSAPDFPLSDKIIFQYALEGISPGWHTIPGMSTTLHSLPSGQYVFLLRARRPDGNWSATVSLPLLITTPWWQQIWFIVLLVAGGIVLIYFFIRWQIEIRDKKRKEKAEVYDKMVRLKQEALSAQINPHFVFNCLNSVQSYIYQNDKDAANEFLVDFATLIRATLENAPHALIGLNTEIERLKLYLSIEKRRFEGILFYNITIDPNLDTDDIKIPNMILQPYVENAIKHGIIPKGAPGCITVNISLFNNSELLIVIEDDGIGVFQGRQSSMLHHSMGMKLTEERLNLLRQMYGRLYMVDVQEIKNKDGEVKGTRVEIRLPLDIMQDDTVLIMKQVDEQMRY